jgi:diadenosine tetraphosphatase ApaH/serine/threonine PP2A family protein phosphatase
MLIALLADIHSNKQAFEACLAHAETQNIDRFVFLGDYVGYGGDPAWTVETIMNMVAKGAVAVQGNHDCTIGQSFTQLNGEAQLVVEWTRGELGVAERRFLAELPLTINDEDRLYVHADASAPERWNYVSSIENAARSMMATKQRLTFVGHVHLPTIYGLSATAKMTSFTPVSGVPVPLLNWRRWHVVTGSVGQPRDGDSAASYSIYDTNKGEITFCRVAYDIEAAAETIRKNGLPTWLAERLFMGK